MFSTILKVIPKIDNATLANMEKTLSTRFTRLAKSFGKGLSTALKGGGVAGALLALIDRILNPLKEVQEALDKSLATADDIATYSEQFQTSTGKLAKLLAFGQAKGLDNQGVYQLLLKYQTALAEAKADPESKSSVKAFANDTDIAESFLEFIQQLQKLSPNDQTLVQQEVFGEKQILKLSELFKADFAKLNKDFGNVDTAKLTRDIEKTASQADQLDLLRAKNTIANYSNKSNVISNGMITARAQGEALEMQRENERISAYKNLQAVNDTVTKIFTLIESLLAQIGSFITFLTPAINTIVDAVKKLKDVKLFRGIFGD